MSSDHLLVNFRLRPWWENGPHSGLDCIIECYREGTKTRKVGQSRKWPQIWWMTEVLFVFSQQLIILSLQAAPAPKKAETLGCSLLAVTNEGLRRDNTWLPSGVCFSDGLFLFVGFWVSVVFFICKALMTSGNCENSVRPGIMRGSGLHSRTWRKSLDESCSTLSIAQKRLEKPCVS